MAHPRWPGYNTKTGNPLYDNQSARMNRRLYREMKAKFKVKAAGRKRRKQLKRVEGARYIILWSEMMNDLARNRAASRAALPGTPEENN